MESRHKLFREYRAIQIGTHIIIILLCMPSGQERMHVLLFFTNIDKKEPPIAQTRPSSVVTSLGVFHLLR
jgi:hypothetical protein